MRFDLWIAKENASLQSHARRRRGGVANHHESWRVTNVLRADEIQAPELVKLKTGFYTAQVATLGNLRNTRPNWIVHPIKARVANSPPCSWKPEMNQHKDYPDWFLWIYERGIILFLLAGAVLMVVVMGLGRYLDQRLDQVEDRLSYVPPASYRVPNLDEFDAGGVEAAQLPTRQRVYVPVYSHVYYQGGSPFLIETTLSIRNTDPENPSYIESVKYYDTSGKLAKTYLDHTIKLAPLQTIEFLVERRDSSGGSGANFIVAWAGESQIDPPLIEAVMVGTAGTQGICFVRSGVNITDENSAPVE